jgi:CRISPR-associated protein Cas8b1/Cst1 subtype I-B
MILAGGEILLSENHKFINYVWNKEELTDYCEECIILPPYKR